MEILKHAEDQSVLTIKKISRALLEGKLVVLPTDTVYGIMALANDEEAVSRLYNVKKRDLKKPSAVLIYSLRTAIDYLGNGQVERLGRIFWPGPLTIVKEPKRKIGRWSKVGIRIPDDEFLLGVLRQVGKPVMASSANISGEPAPVKLADVSPKILEKVSLSVDKGTTALAEESTVIGIDDDGPVILREGPIGIKQIMEAIADG